MPTPNTNPTPNPKTDPSLPARRVTFHEALEMVHNGQFTRDLEAKHNELVEHLMTRGGKGRITITVSYGGTSDKGLEILAESSLKKPKPAARGQFLYATKDGLTWQDDPAEVELDFPTTVKFDPMPKADRDKQRPRASGE